MDTDADAVPPTRLVGRQQGSHGIHLLPIDPDRSALYHRKGESLWIIGSIFREHTHTRLYEISRYIQAFQLPGLMRQTQQIGVRGIGLVLRRLYGQPSSLTEGDHLPASAEMLQKGVIPPRCVDPGNRIQHISHQLESDLVITTASRAVDQHLDAA